MKQNNTYKKSLLVLAFSFFAVTGAFAQFSIGVDLALPMGTMADFQGFGFGASGRYDGAINDNLSWTAGVGYISFSGKDVSVPGFGTISGTSFAMIPIQGGVKYYFTESNAGFYGAADIGIWLAASSGSSGSEFGFSPGVGYRLEKFDIAAKYNAVGNVSSLGFRIAYVLGGN
jgi:hypothetical protein